MIVAMLDLTPSQDQLGCTVIPVSGGMTERQVRLIVDFEPAATTC
jgi:phenylacetate-coenzyme A ligase PaaK-like adenylate-forming protein